MRLMARRKPKRLTRRFSDRPTLEVAPDLIGKCLVHRVRGELLVGRIVEAEAYLDHPDAASHASRKNPTRARIMFGRPGHVYVYMIYGMYYCLNLVTESDGTADAVLVRAVEPVEGIETMRRLRGREMPDRNLTSGPGKLCQAMGVDMALNGIDLCGRGSAAGDMWLEDCGYAPARIRRGPRVGVEYAGKWARKPWRFWEDAHPFVSKTPKARM